MNKYLISLTSLLCCSLVYPSATAVLSARTLEEASVLARRFVEQKSGRMLTADALSFHRTFSQGEAVKQHSFYAFNRKDQKGFVIVSASEHMRPVVAYSNTACLPEGDEMPDNLRSWFQWLDDAAGYLEQHPEAALTSAQQARTVTAVPPLMHSTWDQGWPYNSLCPDGSPTGCVSTATAQVFRHHFAQQGKVVNGRGSHSYYWNGQNYSVDYSAETYDYRLLPLSSDGATEAEQAEIAKLCYHTSVAVDMQFSPIESGAFIPNIPRAAIDNFGFNSLTSNVNRRNYSYDEWLGMIDNELISGRPVIYGGQSSIGGHCFVLEGVNEQGLYYVNWGWSGNYDGYYDIAVLNPTGVGIGASISEDGFCEQQEAILNLTLSEGTGRYHTPIQLWSDFMTASTTAPAPGGEIALTVHNVFNLSGWEQEGQIGLVLTKDGAEVARTQNAPIYSFPALGPGGELSGYGELTSSLMLPAVLPSGTYQLWTYFQPTGKDYYDYVRCPHSMTSYYTLNVEGSRCTLSRSEIETRLTAGHWSWDTSSISTGSCTITVDVSYQGEETYVGKYWLNLTSPDWMNYQIPASEVLTLAPGETGTLSFDCQFDQTGTWSASLLVLPQNIGATSPNEVDGSQSQFVVGIDGGGDISSFDYLIHAIDLTATQGTRVQLPVSLKNEGGVRSFQFDVALPQGVKFATTGGRYEVETASRMEGMTATMSLIEGERTNVMRITCTGANPSAVVAGGDGEVLYLPLSILSEASTGDKVIQYRNLLLTLADGTPYEALQSQTITSQITINASDPDDEGEEKVTTVVNGDLDHDNVLTATDLSLVSGTILEVTAQQEVVAEDGALLFQDYEGGEDATLYGDLNHDGKITIADITMMTNSIQGEMPTEQLTASEDNVLHHAIVPGSETWFLEGYEVNRILKGLVHPGMDDYNFEDYAVRKIVFRHSSDTSGVLLTQEGSPCAAYATFNPSVGTITIHVSGDVIVFPLYMTYLFYNFKALEEIDWSEFQNKIDTRNVVEMVRLFGYCTNLESVDLSSFDTHNVENMGEMFFGCSSLESLDLSYFNTSKVTNMSIMFGDCSRLKTLDLSSFNTENVKQMGAMFNNCSNLQELKLDSFDTRNVENMSNMFGFCTKIRALDLSHFDTKNVYGFWGMFLNCSELQSINLSSFDTSKATNFGGMFDGCKKLKSLDLSSFSTENVYDMSGMFAFCFSLESLDISNFNTSNVTVINNMFHGCSNLRSLDVSHFDTHNVNGMYGFYGMFSGCSSLTSLDVSHFDTSNATNFDFMFSDCSGLTTLDVSHFDTRKAETMSAMFYGCAGLESLDLSNFNTEKVIDMSYMFSYCFNLQSLDVTHFDTRNVENMSAMFQYCMNLESLDINNFITEKVTDMSFMFSACENLGSLDVTHFDTRNVENMCAMFQGCLLQEFDLGQLNTCNVKSMDSMFSNCVNLHSLDVTHFDTRNVESMFLMFHSCVNLESLDLSSFNTQNVKDFRWMFAFCSSLTSLDVSTFDTHDVENMSYMFYCCDLLQALDLSCFNTQNVKDFGWMFGNCTSLTTLDLCNFDTHNAESMYHMFDWCNVLTDLNLGSKFVVAPYKEGMCEWMAATSMNCTITCTDQTKSDLSEGTELNTDFITWNLLSGSSTASSPRPEVTPVQHHMPTSTRKPLVKATPRVAKAEPRRVEPLAPSSMLTNLHK